MSLDRGAKVGPYEILEPSKPGRLGETNYFEQEVLWGNHLQRKYV